MYKSKLQEMCVVKSWTYPKYSSIKDGPDHNPRFTASVFVNGGTFDSPTFCKSVKEAHNKAAEAALIHFISLSSARSPYSSSSVADGKTESKKQEEHESNTSSVVKSCCLKNSKSGANQQESEIEAVKLDMNLLSLEESRQDTGPQLAQGRASKSKRHGKMNPTEDGSLIKGKGKLMSEKANASAEKSLESKKHKDPEVSSFLLCNRVRVYSYVPEVANLPKGATVLQVCENEWVVVSLDFPNEKGN